MDIKRKVELAQQHVKMISQADDVDSHLREAALAKVEKFIANEREAMKTRIEQQAAEFGKD